MVRTDNLSAATHELRDSRGRAMNARYEAVLAHYGLEATRTNPLSSHENGVVEQGHRRLKHAMEQALILRGSRDFVSQEEYEKLLRRVMERRNRLVRARMEQERLYLRPLPPAPIPEYVNYRVRVRKWSTISVSNRRYSVPSRLIGMLVEVRLYADHLEVIEHPRAFATSASPYPGHRQLRVVVQDALGNPAQVGERGHVAITERPRSLPRVRLH